jgi:hypothetical protein
MYTIKNKQAIHKFTPTLAQKAYKISKARLMIYKYFILLIYKITLNLSGLYTQKSRDMPDFIRGINKLGVIIWDDNDGTKSK